MDKQTTTILVTGATGLIGCALVKELLTQPHAHVVALSRTASKLHQLFRPYADMGTFTCVPMDLSNPFDFSSILEKSNHSHFDSVFHAASPISGTTIQQSPLDIIKPNLIATQCLLDGLIKQHSETGIKGRILIFSSATVYGQHKCANISAAGATTHVRASATTNASTVANPNSSATRMTCDKDIIVQETDTMCAESLDSIFAPYSESKRMT